MRAHAAVRAVHVITHHLKVLREAGLGRAQRRGTWVYHASVPDAVARLGAFLTA
ncbi:helix-turn-helix domain-containing protein [Micropruina sonneratiae]|uniref:helix-turn-helix domain-containing protein n=1 Tax=Micropruina sonneratiae TaxID=2986940 RepID=UPI002225C835|nr:helix-turn-helix domain-containing protein [Micropruina sp. KQZ13P-5]